MDFRDILRKQAALTGKLTNIRGDAGGMVDVTETRRVIQLPVWNPDTFEAPDLTQEYRTPNGTMKLRPLQSSALYWMRERGGLAGNLPVGEGKTLISLLAARALGAQRPLLLIPANLRGQLDRNIRALKEHWRIPNIFVVSYSDLSVASGSDLLLELNPDLVIADEAQNIANFEAARTKRFIRYFSGVPSTKFVFLTGTMSKRSLRDYAHLMELALSEGSPMPRHKVDLDAWANVVDKKGKPRSQDWDIIYPLAPEAAADQDVQAMRAAYQLRLRSTMGVIALNGTALDVNLTFKERKVRVPEAAAAIVNDFEATWCRPDGEELMDALAKYRVAGDLSCGFYYRWVWPDGKADEDWLFTRAAWHKYVRRVVQRNQPGLDSPLLVFNAVSHGHLDDPGGRALLDEWLVHRAKFRPSPPTEAVWFSDFLVDDAVEWGKTHPNGIIWYEDNAVGDRLRQRGVRVYGPGAVLPTDGELMALSRLVYGTGTDGLQHHWRSNLFLCWPQEASQAEQNIGRTHRQGQEAEEVEVYYYVHTRQARRALRESFAGAKYVQDTTGVFQKILYGTWENPIPFMPGDDGDSNEDGEEGH